ncbi:MAG: hypothetical protein QUS33_03355, partial [Dehalococcoidia bacterium]|nr:hypothetical protein [Dehalococcoidia bacterium]
VQTKTPGTSENADFYAQLKYDKPQWISMLSYKYFGTDNYSALSPAQQAVVDQADLGTFALSVAQRSPSMPLTSNILYQTLAGNVGTSAAEGWAADVGAGLDRELAFYKWMAYESFRSGTAATFYPTQLAAALPTGKTYASLTTCEKVPVHAALWASLGSGEKTYVTNSAMPGLWGKVQAEMTDVVAIDQTTLAMTLGNTMAAKGFSSETAAANFKADVESGMLLRSAFYKWLARESVAELAAGAVLIRESVGEFYFKITNPNKYGISIDRMMLYFRTTGGALNQVVEGAKQMVEGIWVPAKTDEGDGEVVLKVLAPTKTYDIAFLGLAASGVDVNTAIAVAMDVFDRIQAGTVVWTVQADIQVSHADEVQNYTYTNLTVS